MKGWEKRGSVRNRVQVRALRTRGMSGYRGWFDGTALDQGKTLLPLTYENSR